MYVTWERCYTQTIHNMNLTSALPSWERSHIPYQRSHIWVDELPVKSPKLSPFPGGYVPSIPIPSMYGIFTYIYHKNQPNVGKYAIHGCYGICLFYTLPETNSSNSHLKSMNRFWKVGKWFGRFLFLGWSPATWHRCGAEANHSF